eukprot:RCo022221
MSCRYSPSLWSAVARGDITTVEKHLFTGCCNPLATQYFSDPEERTAQTGVLGLHRRKGEVIAARQNGDNSPSVRPANAVQVALYYRQEGILFLLLNYLLKIAKGNVARCYDDVTEAIAISNGYSHLMEFFVYFDQHSREGFASCWTEAMRHICDLTRELANARQEIMHSSLQGNGRAAQEGETAALRERVSSLNVMLQQKDSIIASLQQSLQGREAAVEELQRQISALRGTLDDILGRAELEQISNTHWSARGLKNQSGVELVHDRSGSEAPAAEEGSQGLLSGSAGVPALSDCMRSHIAAEARLRYLQRHVQQCR